MYLLVNRQAGAVTNDGTRRALLVKEKGKTTEEEDQQYIEVAHC